MKEFFRDAGTLFVQYKEFCSQQQADYDRRANTGDYSKKYLKDLQQANAAERQRERHTVYNRLSKIRESFEADLLQRYDLERGTISGSLQTVLQSGIHLSEAELLRLAEKHKGSLINSRLLHDYAADHGYTLRNYVPLEDCLQAFDNYSRHLSDSMDETNTLPTFTDADSAMEGAGAYCAACMKPKMDIFKTPETIEEHISRDLADRQQAEEPSSELGRSFLEGLNGQQEPEPGEFDDLTHRERQLAQENAQRYGRKEINQNDVDVARTVINDEMAAPEPPETAAEVLNGISHKAERQKPPESRTEPRRGQKKGRHCCGGLPLVGLFFGWSFSE